MSYESIDFDWDAVDEIGCGALEMVQEGVFNVALFFGGPPKQALIDNEPTGLQFTDIRLAYPQGTIFHRVEELPVYAQSQIEGVSSNQVDHIPVFISKHRMVYANLRTEYPALYHLLNAQIFTPEEFDALLISSRFALILMAFDIIGKDNEQFVFCGRCYHEELVKRMRAQLVEFMPLLHEYLNKPEVQAQIKQLEQLNQAELS